MSGTGWILSFVTAVVAVCAILAALGFKGRVTTVGIDLGTTFSVVGFSQGNSKGVTIISDNLGRNLFPSVVTYSDNGIIYTGYDAISYLQTQPENTIFNSKRFIGKSLEDDDVKQYANSHPFTVVKSNTSIYSEVGFLLKATGHPEVVSPENIGTEILKALLRITSKFLGHSQVNKAIIAVPAKFNSNQRAATAAAYKAAGLKVVRVIEEPTAAAVAYKLHKKSNISHILVYDFGGGTLDVSLLFVSKGSVQVYATDGDDTLGGSDLDACLYNIIKTKVELLTGTTISGTHNNDINNSNNNKEGSVPVPVPVPVPSIKGQCLSAGLLEKAEQVKKDLTNKTETTFSCVMPKSLEEVSFLISRQDFETGCDHLFERSILPVQRLLSDLEMHKDNIDEVVLVGGSTRIPKVKELLKSFFGKPLNDRIDPDITVAYGAASVLD